MNKKIAVITPGGDAPGMNACIRAVVKYGIKNSFEPWGIKRGYQGLLENDFTEMKSLSVSGIIHHGGTILKSNRCAEIRTEKGLEKAAENLKNNGIQNLVVIGGDGSLYAGYRLSKRGIKVTGIPASIDNDIFGTDETVGFDTALDTAVQAVDKIRDTATSFERVFVVEVMGRKHGFLALDVAAASGAEFVIIPEVKYDIKDIAEKLRAYKEKGKTSLIIIFAEGAGNSMEFGKRLSELTGLEVRVSTLGYIQRGGEPSGRSRILALKMGSYAVELIKKNIDNMAVVSAQNKIRHLPLSAVAANSKKINLSYKTLIEKTG